MRRTRGVEAAPEWQRRYDVCVGQSSALWPCSVQLLRAPLGSLGSTEENKIAWRASDRGALRPHRLSTYAELCEAKARLPQTACAIGLASASVRPQIMLKPQLHVPLMVRVRHFLGLPEVPPPPPPPPTVLLEGLGFGTVVP